MQYADDPDGGDGGCFLHPVRAVKESDSRNTATGSGKRYDPDGNGPLYVPHGRRALLQRTSAYLLSKGGEDMQFRFELEGGNFSKAGYASSQIKKVLKQLAIDPRIIKRVVVALYEAEVNIVAHAWRGTVVAELDADKISLELKDEGPGIPDISLAMREGYSTASEAVREMGFGAGMGLPNMKKNVDELTIESQVDVGTTVRMVTWFNKKGA